MSLEMAVSFLLSYSLQEICVRVGLAYNHIVTLNYILRLGNYFSFMLTLNSLYFFTQKYEEENYLLLNGLGVIFIALTNVGAIAKGVTGI